MRPVPQPLYSLQHPAETASQLNELGLTEALLTKPARRAYDDVERCTGNDVASMARYLAWGKVLRYLRDELIPMGWSKGRHPELESIVSPDRSFRILSVGGNWATGTDQMPATLNDKGPLTGFAVDDNRQIAFDPSVLGGLSEDDMLTYFFLHYEDEHAEEIRLELSVPTHRAGMRKSKRAVIDQFGPRIPLRPISLAADEADARTDADAEYTDEIDVPVARRSS
jgi:hypothetical protein